MKNYETLEEVKDSYIQQAIDKCKCPEPIFCTVTTTCYETPDRERMCLKCWLDWCDRNGVEINYESQTESKTL